MAGGERQLSRRLMIVGAGCTGRGHIGELAHEAGWKLVLVDRDADLVRTLRRAGEYTVELYGPDWCRRVRVEGLRASGESGEWAGSACQSMQGGMARYVDGLCTPCFCAVQVP